MGEAQEREATVTDAVPNYPAGHVIEPHEEETAWRVTLRFDDRSEPVETLVR